MLTKLGNILKATMGAIMALIGFVLIALIGVAVFFVGWFLIWGIIGIAIIAVIFALIYDIVSD